MLFVLATAGEAENDRSIHGFSGRITMRCTMEPKCDDSDPLENLVSKKKRIRDEHDTC